MPSYRQTNEGGVVGNSVTVNSGGSADGSTPYNAVSVGSGTTLQYDNSQALFPGGNSIQIATSTAAVAADMSWTTSISWSVPLYYSQCFYFPALPPSQLRLATLLTGSTIMCGINLLNSGLLQMQVNGAASGNTSNAIATGQWVRVDMALLAASSTVGQAECRIFNDPFSDTINSAGDVRTTNPTVNTTGGTPSEIRTGLALGVSNVGPFWTTQMQVSTTDYPPPPQFIRKTQFPATKPSMASPIHRAALI